MSIFSEVFQNLDMDLSDKELMKNAEVLKVAVPEDRSALTVYLRNKEDLPRSTLTEAEAAIKSKIFGGKNIRVSIMVTGVSSRIGGSGSSQTSGQSSHGASGNGNAARHTSDSGSQGRGGYDKNGKLLKKPGQTGYKEADTRYTPKQDKKSQNPDVIYGYDFSGEPLSISSLQEGMGAVIINGKLFGIEIIKTRNGKFIYKFNITDNTDSISCKLFCDENAKNELESKLKDGVCVSLSGELEPPNQYSPELSIGRIRGIKKAADPRASRMDTHEGAKRIELDLHTKMSDMDGIGDVADYIKLAESLGNCTPSFHFG